MALIRTFEPDPRTPSGAAHGPVRCTYFIFVGPDEQPFLQFSTYGSARRKDGDRPSQTIQLDRAGMKRLAGILVEALEGPRAD